MHKVNTDIIPFVIGTLGTVPKRLPRFVNALGIPDVIASMQTTVYCKEQLGSLRIFAVSELIC